MVHIFETSPLDGSRLGRAFKLAISGTKRRGVVSLKLEAVRGARRLSGMSSLKSHSHRALEALQALESVRQMTRRPPRVFPSPIRPLSQHTGTTAATPLAHVRRACTPTPTARSQRPTATKLQTMELSLPPRPVPRRKRAFILPGQMAPPAPPPPRAEVVLDGFVLLEACRCEDPDEAEKAVLEGCGITSVISEDLSFFRKLSHLDLGDNQVPLATLAYLPALLELHLDCNGLAELSVPPGGFPVLEVLNLSYNGLSSAAVAALADISRLRQLDISMNELSALPADMSGFAALQSLNCEHNRLNTEASLLALGTLPSLRSLSLAHNGIEALAASATDTIAYAQLSTLDLSNNAIAREEALLPVLQMTSLRTLLLYGNPFLHRGAASDDFHEVLAVQRGMELVVLPPPPPPPPAKIDLSCMTTVAEPPVRRKIPTGRSAMRKPAPKPAETPEPEEDDSSFFLTSGGATDAPKAPGPEQMALLEAQAQALEQDVWGPADEVFDATVDIRTAAHALKAAIDRPPVHVSLASAPHLKLTASILNRQRQKHQYAPPEGGNGGRKPAAKLVTGAAAPQRAGGAVEDMAAGIGELQQRMGAQLAAAGGVIGGATLDPEGDACVSSLQSMLHAMQDMSVGAGAGGGALPQQA